MTPVEKLMQQLAKAIEQEKLEKAMAERAQEQALPEKRKKPQRVNQADDEYKRFVKGIVFNHCRIRGMF